MRKLADMIEYWHGREQHYHMLQLPRAEHRARMYREALERLQKLEEDMHGSTG